MLGPGHAGERRSRDLPGHRPAPVGIAHSAGTRSCGSLVLCSGLVTGVAAAESCFLDPREGACEPAYLAPALSHHRAAVLYLVHQRQEDPAGRRRGWAGAGSGRQTAPGPGSVTASGSQVAPLLLRSRVRRSGGAEAGSPGQQLAAGAGQHGALGLHHARHGRHHARRQQLLHPSPHESRLVLGRRQLSLAEGPRLTGQGEGGPPRGTNRRP